MKRPVQHETFPPEGERTALNGRRGDRVALEIITEIKLGFGQWQKTRLSDLSATGFRIGWLPNGGQGAEVRLRIPGMEPLLAYVRWRDNTGMGCEFARPLSVYVLDHLARTCAG
jgi:hypothetical protein